MGECRRLYQETGITAEMPLVEWEPIADTIIDGVTPIRVRGDRVRVAFWAEHYRYEDGEEIAERVVVARITMTAEAFEVIRHQMREVSIVRDWGHGPRLKQLPRPNTSSSRQPH